MRLLCTKQAALAVNMSVRTLERKRLAGTGPKYAKLGKLIRYQEEDLQEWALASLRTSTSQAADTERNRGKSVSSPIKRPDP